MLIKFRDLNDMIEDGTIHKTFDLSHFDDVCDEYIVKDMFHLFDGKVHKVEILQKMNERKFIEICDHYGNAWFVNERWIDNRIQLCYKDMMNLFKEPL